MNSQSRIAIPEESIKSFCRRHHITRLSLFGSVLRDDFRPDSDVDVLVEFQPNHVPGFIRLHQIEEELSSLLGGRKIDLLTPKSLNRRLRDRILSTAQVQYAEG